MIIRNSYKDENLDEFEIDVMFFDRLQTSKSFQFFFETINSSLFLFSLIDKIRDLDDLFVNALNS